MIMGNTKFMKIMIFGIIRQTNGRQSAILAPIPQILHTYACNACLQVPYSLCIEIMIMVHTNYENSDFRQNSAKKNGRRSAILATIHL